MLGSLFTQGAVFITSIALGRLLGKDLFGEFGMVMSTQLALTGIAQVSTGLMATKFTAEFREVDKVRAGQILGLCGVLTLVTGLSTSSLMFVSAPWVAEHILVAPQLSTAVVISSGFVLFSIMNGYQVGALAGFECYKSICIYGALIGITQITLSIFGAIYWGLNGALAGIAICSFLRWLCFKIILNQEMKKYFIIPSYLGFWRQFKVLHSFALPAALAGFITIPAIWLSNLFLVRLPNGYAEMGVYSAANSLRLTFLFLPILLNSVAIPLINNYKGQGKKNLYSSVFFSNLKLTVVTAFIGALLMLCFGAHLLGVFGTEFVSKNVDQLIFFISISIFLEATGIALYQSIQSHEKMWLSFFVIALPRDLLIVLAAYFFTKSSGSVGLSAAHTLGLLYAVVIKIYIVYKFNLHNKV